MDLESEYWNQEYGRYDRDDIPKRHLNEEKNAYSVYVFGDRYSLHTAELAVSIMPARYEG
jgi:hypothetical protein